MTRKSKAATLSPDQWEALQINTDKIRAELFELMTISRALTEPERRPITRAVSAIDDFNCALEKSMQKAAIANIKSE